MKQIFASFGLQRQKQIRKAALISFGVVVVLALAIVAVKVLKEQTKAITGDGDKVTITQGESVNYGTWLTHKYTVSTGSGDIRGFCVEPKKNSPSGEYTSNVVATNNKSKKIKLAIWAWVNGRESNPVNLEQQTAKALLNILYGSQQIAETYYAFIHALIGYIYSGDTIGLTQQEITYIQEAGMYLESEINSNNDSWTIAKDYRLYELSDVPGEYQNIMWIEKNRQYSLIEVQKCDTLNTSCTPTGFANFSGVVVKLYYIGSTRVYDETRDTILEPNQPVGNEKLTDDNGIVRFGQVPLGKYEVVETDNRNPSLVLQVQEVIVEANTPGRLYTPKLKNKIVRADIEFQKVDNKGRPMANIPFRITAEKGEESHIVVSDQDGLVSTRKYAHNNHTNGYDNMDVNTITDLGYGTWFGKDGPNAQTPINNDMGALPYDTYTITEIACNNNDHCYDIGGQSITIDKDRFEGADGLVIQLGDWNNDCVNYTVETTATDNEDGDKIISNKQNAQIKDRVEYCVKKNTTYKLVGTLVDGSGLPIIDVGARQEVDINPGNQECGTVDMVFTFDARHLGGQDVVVYEKIYKPTDMTNPVASHTEATNQTVSVFSLETIATDANDEAGTTAAKSIEDKPDQKIKDSIDYCLKAGTSYTLKGILMDKETGEKLTINGETFEKSVNITPSANCGKAELIFDLDASELKGKRIVVYEYAYEGETLVEKHENINDENQTIAVYSLGTKATDLADDNQSIEAAANQTIKDSVEFCLTSNRTYTLKGVLMDKATRERVLIDGEPIEKSLNITPSTDCGIAELDFGIDATEFAGKQIIVFETLYEGEEEIIKHEDFEDQNQTIDIYSLETTASDPADGDKDILGTTESKIKDTIDYCLTAGKEYTVKGILMDKDTKKPLMVNGGTIENSITFTPSENCGTIEMEFTLDASHLKGIEIVVFESVYLGTDLVIEHNDIDDESQAVYIYIPPPNTGSFTGSTAAGKQDSVSNNTFPVIIIGAIALAGLGIGCGFFLRHRSVKFN